VISAKADVWNRSAPERARRLNRVAKLRADRELRRRGIAERRGRLAFAWEEQKRGVLHQHFILGLGHEDQDAWGTNVDALWSKLYAAALDELAPRYGFGFVDTGPLGRSNPRPAREAAAYMSGYFITGKSDKAKITETVRSKSVPPLVVWVSSRLTRVTFCTMQNLRRARRLFMHRRGRAPAPKWELRELLQVLVVLDRLDPEIAARAP